MSRSSSSSSGGITFLGALTILFIGLKLTNNIDWSWLWVLSPLWLGAAIVIAFAFAAMAFGGFIAMLAAILKALFGRRPKRPFR